MADRVLLLNLGRIEQVGSPRDIYAQPASLFAARFIGTPPMSVMAVDGAFILGSSVAVNSKIGNAHIAIRPEHVTLDGDIPATVTDCEYLGADSLVH